MSRCTGTILLLALIGCALGACTRGSGEAGGGQVSLLSCGGATFRITPERVDAPVNAACEQAKKSAEALKTYRATIGRFTCQESDGHVILSVTAPRDEFDDYDANCRQYLAVQEAFRNRSIDIAAHQSASRDFTAKNNELARRHLEADNVLFRGRKADQAALASLVKERGGSIEIAN